LIMAHDDTTKPLDGLRSILDQGEAEGLNPLAVRSMDGVRRSPEPRLEEDYRQSFAVDVDRILYSLAYTRYFDKTQVFYLIENDHITHRMLHVQLVSKVARTIGRFLGLNGDLIEAIAIGHDIGHPPFGHDGERFLSDICVRHGIGRFLHNVQSVQFLEKVERKGRGWNLCLQTLDGILCHDGEIHNRVLTPARDKGFADHDREVDQKKAGENIRLVPMTLEGCVVRFADTISYIGRDIEDAIRLNLISRSDLPEKSVESLGNTNGTIVYALVTDVIRNSHMKPYIAFSEAVSEALVRLKGFNYEQIYMNPRIKKHQKTIHQLFEILFERFLKDIRNKNLTSPIYVNFIDGMSPEYMRNHCPEEVVRDFISGMTDGYFLKQSPDGLNLKTMIL
jgi:dGTPase